MVWLIWIFIKLGTVAIVCLHYTCNWVNNTCKCRVLRLDYCSNRFRLNKLKITAEGFDYGIITELLQ